MKEGVSFFSGKGELDFKNEMQLLENEAKFRSLMEMSGWFWETDEKLKYSYSNIAVLEFLGYEISQFLGMSLDDVFLKEENKNFWLFFEDMKKNGKAMQNVQAIATSKNHQKVFLEVNMIVLNEDLMTFGGFAKKVEQDFRLRSLYEQNLKRAKEEAERASRIKSEFLINMGHEIRTPLNCILGFASLLKRTVLDDEQKEYVSDIITSGEVLLETVSNVLDFSKIEAEEMALYIEKVDLLKLVEQVMSVVRYQACCKNLKVIETFAQDLPKIVECDFWRLKQILINLMSNALKFTEQGEVELKIDFEKMSNEKGKVNFFIKDTGIGIAKEDQVRVFEPFVQADGSTTRKYGGTGLGLTIAGYLVKKMGSVLKVDSELGQGSSFYFTLELFYKKDKM